MDVDISYFFYNIQCFKKIRYLLSQQSELFGLVELYGNFRTFGYVNVSGTYITIHLHTLYTYYYKHLRNSYLGDTDGL